MVGGVEGGVEGAAFCGWNHLVRESQVIYAAVGALINLVTCKDMRIDFVREGGVHTLRDLLHDNQPEIIIQASTATLWFTHTPLLSLTHRFPVGLSFHFHPI